MDSELRKQPEVISIQENQVPHIVVDEIKKQKDAKISKKIKLSSFQQFLQREGVIDVLILIVILLFMAFVFKLCCAKKVRDPRIIRGRGTGSSVLTTGSKKALRNSSLKSNHRNGMKVPELKTTSISEQSDSDEDF